MFYIHTTSQAQPIVLESSASSLMYRRQPLPRLPTRSQSTPLEDRRRVPLLWVPRFAAGDPLASGILRASFGCQGKTAVRRSPLTWDCFSRILLVFRLNFVLRLLPVGHQVRPDAVEDTTLPRHLVRFEHHPVPGPCVKRVAAGGRGREDQSTVKGRRG